MSGEGFFGHKGLGDDTDEVNAREFALRQALGRVRTNVPVKVVAVHDGGVGPAGTVDVQVMIKQYNGVGEQQSHGIIYGIPWSRSQGGGNAIINDPKVDDIGFISIADRDISSLKANEGKESQAGSFRTHDLADGIYNAAMLNPANPDQYVHFTDTGVTIVSKNGCSVTLDGDNVYVNPAGNVYLGGSSSGGMSKVVTLAGPSINVYAKV